MKELLYFGYGANKSPDMMEAIIGRKPIGFSAVLKDYELYVLGYNDFPRKARDKLKEKWSTEFRTYCIRPKIGKKAIGKAWYLTPLEREFVRAWEFWYKSVPVKISDKDGKIWKAETEVILDKKIKSNVSGEK